ncbi:MAG TPA: HEAT repeat domain-containing protein [Thermoleophilia bacterium]
MDQHLTDLIEALGSDDGSKRKRARETLALLGEPAVQPLHGLLSSSTMRIRWEAANCLAAMVDPGSVQAFVELMMDQYSEVRWLAASGLINLGPRSVAPVLESLIQDAESSGHRQMARRVLRGLSSGNDVLAEIVGPVVDVLGHADSAVIASKAAVALNELGQTAGPR